MASKQIALVLRKKCGRIGTILIYAVLEWMLILMLLIGALWSYLTRKFAEFFGLHPPCAWCSRLDHLLGESDPGFFKRLLCDRHAKEISSLGYCHIHRNLADVQGMCEDCLISFGLDDESRSSSCKHEELGSFFTRKPEDCSSLKGNGCFLAGNNSKTENNVGNSNSYAERFCSCCHVSFKRKLVLRPIVSAEMMNDHGDKGIHMVSSKKEEEISDFGKTKREGKEPEMSETKTAEFNVFVSNQRGSEFENEETEGIESYRLDSVGYTELKSTSDSGSEDAGSRDSSIMIEDNTHDLQGENTEVKSTTDLLGDFTSNLSDFSSNPAPGSRLQNGADMLEVVFNSKEQKATPEQTQQENNLEKEYQKEIENPFHGSFVASCSPPDVSMPMNEQGVPVPASVPSSEANAGYDHIFRDLPWDGIPANIQTSSPLNNQVTEQSPSNTVSRDFSFFQTHDGESSEISFIMNIPKSDKPVSIEDSSAGLISTKGDIFNFKVEQNKSQKQDNLLKRSFSTRETAHNDDNNWQTLLTRSLSIKEGYQNDVYNRQNVCGWTTVIDECRAPETPNSTGGVNVLQKRVPADRSEYQHDGQNRQSVVGGTTTAEDYRASETPRSAEGVNVLQKRVSIERNDSGFDSREGSVLSEIEGESEVDRLKRHLQYSQKYSANLYTELDAERNASADAANQAMAMITRLQEEKAAIQMEALQYQRMVEEQAEYDQEALRLMNELLEKREKEIKDLERELQLYRKRFLSGKAKKLKGKHRKTLEEETRSIQMATNGQTQEREESCNSSSVEDSDDSASTMNEEFDFSYLQQKDQHITIEFGMDESGTNGEHRMNDNFEESMVDLEEERLSILEQLKNLEERLYTLAEEDDSYVSGPLNRVSGSSVLNSEVNRVVDECPPIFKFGESNRKVDLGDVNRSPHDIRETSWDGYPQQSDHSPDKISLTGCHGAPTAKRLLPSFERTDSEELIAVQTYPADQLTEWRSRSMISRDNGREIIEEEVQQLNERLQALEADREFIKHSIKSLRKGDQGMNLLHEIVQHLRELRRIDARASSHNDSLMQQNIALSPSQEDNGIITIHPDM
eukprot:TRINITY_DN16441_c0_g1_i1.p1 TRINITY_DN16441_c0_g1~~TRINITY_DN16441_c0_g1_i1.p1  ORF type:complete len:1082 (-),score=258.06 TRINITY_DN16441_c0_g1_i1:260-3505(-)